MEGKTKNKHTDAGYLRRSKWVSERAARMNRKITFLVQKLYKLTEHIYCIFSSFVNEIWCWVWKNVCSTSFACCKLPSFLHSIFILVINRTNTHKTSITPYQDDFFFHLFLTSHCALNIVKKNVNVRENYYLCVFVRVRMSMSVNISNILLISTFFARGGKLFFCVKVEIY